MPETSTCPGCGLELPVFDGPAHEYIGASPACWALYGELLARDYGEYGMPDEHKFIVDAYATQHPGKDERRARQSVAVHLIRLCLMLERGRDVGHATRMISKATNSGLELKWFEPITPLGTITAQDVLAAEDFDAHVAKAREWAEDQWQAWSAQQQTIREWCDALEAHVPRGE
jgi:hypothetical protein